MSILDIVLLIISIVGVVAASYFIVVNRASKDSVLSSISSLITFIRTAEEAFPEKGAGEIKKSWVLAQVAYFGEESMKKIGDLIDSLVAFMNTFGWAK